MLLVTICQRPYSKILHGSCTTIRCLSTNRHRKIIKLGTSSKLGSCISFWEKCISLNRGSYTILPVHLVITCKRPHSKVPHGCLTILKCLSKCHIRKIIKVANPNKSWSYRDKVMEIWSPFPNDLIFLHSSDKPHLNGVLFCMTTWWLSLKRQTTDGPAN